MIEVKRRNDGVSITGHADYAEPGKDIVCAGVSVLVQTLIQSIEELTADKIQYAISPGKVDIKHGKLSEQAQALMASFFIGIQMIADEYPANVRVAQAFKA